VKYFFQIPRIVAQTVLQTKEPAIDIAGLCLPLKPQKEKVQNIFHAIYSLVSVNGQSSRLSGTVSQCSMVLDI